MITPIQVWMSYERTEKLMCRGTRRFWRMSIAEVAEGVCRIASLNECPTSRQAHPSHGKDSKDKQLCAERARIWKRKLDKKQIAVTLRGNTSPRDCQRCISRLFRHCEELTRAQWSTAERDFISRPCRGRSHTLALWRRSSLRICPSSFVALSERPYVSPTACNDRGRCREQSWSCSSRSRCNCSRQ